MSSSPFSRPTTILAAACIALVAAACGDDTVAGPGEGPEVASLTVTSPSASIGALDATVQLTTTALDEDGAPVAGAIFTWTSSAADVASVDDDGLVTAIANGTTSVTARAGGASGSVSITVEQAVVEVSLTSQPTNGSVDASLGGVTVEVLDANGHLATNYAGPVVMAIGTNPLGGTLNGQVSRNASAGVATFTGLTLDAAGAGYTLAATADGVTRQSDPFNITLPSVYVGHFAGSAVTVIDSRSDTVLATVTVGSQPTGVAPTPDGLFVYASNRASGYVSVIETPGNTVVDSIEVGTNAQLLAMSPLGGLVYVGVSSVDSVAVIATATNTVVATVQVVGFPVGVAISPDEAFAYVSSTSANYVSIFETGGHTLVDTVHVGNGPLGVAVTPDGSHVYVTNSQSASVSVIETATKTVVATVPVGSSPQLLAITPDGSSVFVASTGTGSVSRIDTGTNTVTATIAVGGGPIGVTVAPDGGVVYVSNNSAGTVSVIDVATNMTVSTITVAANPAALAALPAPVP